MSIIQSATCWICGAPADSGEHIFKARDLKRIFDKYGYAPEALPLHISVNGERKLLGPKSDRMKYPRVICQRCNNDRTSKFDSAYDKLTDWFMAHQADFTIAQMDFFDVFGADYAPHVEDLRRYFAKNLGCRIVAGGGSLPAGFPNPLSGESMPNLQVSVCWSELFRELIEANGEKYYPKGFGMVLSKGTLYIKYSRSYFESTGERLVTSAVWWETIGHFQINYWFNVSMNPVLGGPFIASSRIYRIRHSNLGLDSLNQAMFNWFSTHS